MRVAALTAAFAAAAWLPGEPLGVAVPIVAVLIAVAVRRANPFYGALAIALAVTAAIRDAGWIVAIDLLAAWIVASVAVARPAQAALWAPFRRLRDVPELVPETPETTLPALRGVVFGGLLALPFGALFMSADAAFEELVHAALPDPGSVPARTFTFLVVLLAALGLALAARRPLAPTRPRRIRRLSLPEWVVPLALLDLLFLAFVVVQLTVLFGGHDYVLRSAGLTYAQYARSGFWQLVAVAALTLAVVAAALRLARARGRRRRLLNALLGVLLACTVVVVASALHRLDLYQDVYGATRTRLVVEWACFGIAAVIALVAAALAVRRVARNFAHFAVGGTALALLAFSLANPDGLVAAANVERWRETGKVDESYLQQLSADAVPALAALPPPMRERVLRCARLRLAEDEPWSSWNLGRARARDRLAQLPSQT